MRYDKLIIWGRAYKIYEAEEKVVLLFLILALVTREFFRRSLDRFVGWLFIVVAPLRREEIYRIADNNRVDNILGIEGFSAEIIIITVVYLCRRIN